MAFACAAVLVVKLVGDVPIVDVSIVVDFVGETIKSLRLRKSPDVAPPRPMLAPIPPEFPKD